MLDAATLALRIRDALDKHEPPIKPADVAKAFSVTPQAVNGWLKHGRIGKGRLLQLAQMTGKPASYFLGGEIDQSLEAQAFQLAEDWLSLKNPEHRLAVRGVLDKFLAVVQQFPELELIMDDEKVKQRIAPASIAPSVKREPHKGKR